MKENEGNFLKDKTIFRKNSFPKTKDEVHSPKDSSEIPFHSSFIAFLVFRKKEDKINQTERKKKEISL